MRKLRVMTVVGTRPEIIRLSCVIPALDASCDHILVHTGQNYDYELSQVFFEELRLRGPDYYLKCGGQPPAAMIGAIIASVDGLLSETPIDAMLVLGDTNSCLAAIAAKRRHIPVFHMEAGNRCFDQRVPEELNRKIVDHVADINLPYSEIARHYLISEGIPPDRVIKTGSPLFEVLAQQKYQILASDVIERFELSAREYYVVSAHREENIENDINFARLIGILNAIAEHSSRPVIVSTHPRTQNRVTRSKALLHSGVQLSKPMGFHDYVRLQQGARAVLSDSGTITEESSILAFPALNIREAHERPEGMDEASVVMTGLNIERIWQGLTLLERYDATSLRTPADYLVPNVAEKVVRIIHSYTDYVRRTIYREQC